MAEKIRAGIVGATVSRSGSGWGAHAHVPALKSLPDYELKAVCTAHEESAKASAEAFGAELAFHDFDTMIAHPDIDLVIVCVKVPSHYDLVMRALRAGKAVFCEWPLAANLQQAEEMAALARERSLRTSVGLQCRSDPTLLYAQELLRQGYIGEVLSASMTITRQASTERTSDRVWQADRAAGANPLTIDGGHNIDSVCMLLGEFREVSGRVTTRVKEWRQVDTGTSVPVTAPDTIAFAGRLDSGAEASVYVASVPAGPAGYRLDVYGREGALTLTCPGSAHIGPNEIYAARGRSEAMQRLDVPDRFTLVPEGTPSGQPYNVAQAYARFAESLQDGSGFEPDFEVALRRHRLLEAVERSSSEGRAVKV